MVIAVLLIIGIWVVVAKGGFEKDIITSDNSNQMSEINTSADTSANTSTNTASPWVNNQPSVTTSNNADVTQTTTDDWEGEYRFVEFGDIVPDSDPMRYDAYAYTTLSVYLSHGSYQVTITQQIEGKEKIERRGIARVDEAGLLQVTSDQGAWFVTLENGDFGANNDTKMTWIDLKPLLPGTANAVFMHRNIL